MKLSAAAHELLNTTVFDFYRPRRAAGEIGLELECEGNNLRAPPVLEKWWKSVPDNSLRGEAAEFVLKSPIKRDKVDEALRYLQKMFNENNVQLNMSYRTSTHVHVNVQELSFKVVVNYLVLYFIFEDLLSEFCGEDRKGNLFCLRARDAEGLIDALREAIQRGRWMNLHDDNRYKYGAVNVSAMGNYGSLEFRAMRGVTDINIINQWVTVLLDIKDAAMRYEDPSQIIADFSARGPKEFVAETFRPANAMLLFGVHDFERSIYEGVRISQELAFAVDSWDYEPLKKESTKRVYGGADELNVLDQMIKQIKPARWAPPPVPNRIVILDDQPPVPAEPDDFVDEGDEDL